MFQNDEDDVTIDVMQGINLDKQEREREKKRGKYRSKA